MENILYLHAGAELYGADIVLLQLMKNLNREKYKLHIILPCDGPLVEEMKKIGAEVSILEYPILRRKYFNIKGIVKYLTEFYKKVGIIEEYCVKNNIQLIHSNTMAVLEGILLKKKLKVNLVWHIHEILTKPKFINKFLSKIIANNADKVVAVSNAVRQHLISTGKFRNDIIEVVYNGVDNNTFNENNEVEYLKKQYHIADDEMIIGMIGRVNSWKGQLNFLKAINIILPKYPKVKAIMVGGIFDGEEWRMETLKKEVSKSPVHNRIIIDDFRKDTANLHCLYDIFVLPSIQPDPLPTVVLESMASGNPIVGYSHGGVTEMVKEGFNGLLAEVNNYEDLAEKIEILIKDNELRKTMGANSSSRQREQFSLTSYVNNFERIYDSYLK